MLKKFSVTNFKNFSDELIFDLGSAKKNYEFNSECISSDIVRLAQIYGPNASGKSNLGLAIFDLISHLTDNRTLEEKYSNYKNAYKTSENVRFKYDFSFNSLEVNYTYEKSDHGTLLNETLVIDGETILNLDRSTSISVPVVKLKDTQNLSLENLKENDISIAKYVFRNTALDNNDPKSAAFSEFMSFINQMLYIRATGEYKYQGKLNKIKSITSYFIEKDRIKDFQHFLCEAGIECELTYEDQDDTKKLFFNFSGKKISFTDAASTGTMSLFWLYFWLIQLEEQKANSLIFIDEFDAFYHHALSSFVVNRLKKMEWLQIILTTHNTTLMSNELLRPDCNFIINKNKIGPIHEFTDKELREAHNIEKMYRAGAFEHGE